MKTTLRTVLPLVFMLFALTANAKHIGENEARRRAQAFMQQRGMAQNASMSIAAKGHRKQAKANSECNYYVFNMGQDEGFVIVSGNDQTTEILGYADQGTINPDNMPAALAYWLEGYEEQMAWIDEHQVAIQEADNAALMARAPQKAAATRTAIAPIINTRWDQKKPYNDNCPTINEEHTVTGCVATAMAQVMYYHQYPATTMTAIPGYTTSNGLCTIEELPTTTFDWTNMANTYTSSSTGAAAQAVAKLMQYCGAALQMNYNLSSANGSSTYNACIPDALKKYFGYSTTVSYAKRQHYTYTEWIATIYNELAQNRPVVLGGQSIGGGHSFVCDGYQGDDFFHINWGWGGKSDGYFRLSLLNPYEQGIGGSSTLDGFSYSQDAIIGIQPGDGSQSATALSLEKMQINGGATQKTLIVNRQNSGDSFEGISLYVGLCSYLFGTNNYDYAIVLTDEEGNTLSTLHEVSNQSMPFNSDLNLTPENLKTPEALADGTYYIKVLNRPYGTSTWMPCYGSEQLQLQAIVSGNTLTITAPVVLSCLPTAVSITASGNMTKGYEQSITASITGGSIDYHGNIVLRVNGKSVMGKAVEIPAQQTVDVTFSYIPTTAGDNVLTLYNAKSGGSQIGSATTIVIEESDATNDLDLGFSATFHNMTDGKLYGNAMRASVTVTNPSTTNSYVGQLNCSTRQWTQEGEEWIWESLGVSHYTLVVGKEGTTTIEIAADDLPSEGHYSFRLTYQRVSGDNTVADALHLGLINDIGSIEIVDGYRLGNAQGEMSIYPPAETINAVDACFADLRGLSSLSGVTVTPSSNPNCIYLINDGADMPSGLDGRNVVIGTNADNITLSDGADFFTPIAFNATNISYVRTFTQPAGGTTGWSTICLPFAVETIECNGKAIDWFHSDSDSGKNFWLKAFSADETGNVIFDYAANMTAMTPYIIAVPGDTWGDEWKMTERPVTFSAANASVAATTTAQISGNHYRLCGSTTTNSLSNIYVLNSKGSKFVKKESVTVEPFRAWFTPVSISALTLASLSMSQQETNAIVPLRNDGTANTSISTGWYTLDGRKMQTLPSTPGIYISNGRKIIVK